MESGGERQVTAGLKPLLLLELALYFLLLLVATHSSTGVAVTHALPESLLTIMRHQPGEAVLLYLSGDQFLDKGDINAHPVGNAAGANLVGMKFSNDVYLFLTAVRALAGVAVRGRRGA